MQILKDENGKIIQTAEVGGIPGGMEIDLSNYILDESGNLILDTEKIKARQNAVRRTEILARLSEIDSESIRPLRAVAAKTATDFDTEKLAALESEAAELREELKGLEI